MEIGKSDQIGKMGEEAARALNVSRFGNERLFSAPPLDGIHETNQAAITSFLISRHDQKRFKWLFESSAVVLASCVGILVQKVVNQYWLWLESDLMWDIVQGISAMFGFWLVQRLQLKSRGCFLTIERGQRKVSSPTAPREFWSGSGIPEESHNRPLALVLRFVAGFTLLMFGLFGVPTELRVTCAVGLVFFAYDTFRVFRPQTRCLLGMDEKNVHINGRSLSWSEINSVQVNHIFELHGEFEAVRLVFRENGSRKIAQVTLPKDRCSVSAENVMLQFIAGVLGGSVKTIAPGRQL